MLINFDAIPEYRAAVERVNFVRDVAFSGVLETCAGIEVLPLTFRHWQWLGIIGSPFLGVRDLAAETLAGDIAGFFWTIAPMRNPAASVNDGRQRAAKKKFLRSVGKLKLDFAISEIRSYISDAFMDAPAGRGNGDNTRYFSMGAVIVHRLCSAYGGLTPFMALDVPLKQGFQLLKLINREELAKVGKRPINFNPTDNLKGKLAGKIHRFPDCEEAKLAVIQRN